MYNKYQFKRNFYYEAKKAIEEYNINFILGARKCGKTVCMKQLGDDIDNAVYVDMKTDFDDDSHRRDFVRELLKSIAEDKKIVYLIDEATYMAMPDKEISKIASAFSEYENANTKFVFSGSQSKALETWGHIACGGNAKFIKTDFLSYPEWLAYKGITEVSEKTYLAFLFHVREFYKDFSNTKEYLQGCLDETVISNRKAIEYVVGNNAEDLTVEMLLDVLYASLVKLHNHTNYHSFSNRNLLSDTLAYYFGKSLSESEMMRMQENIGGRYNNFTAMRGYDCKKAMQFLTNCGLTTLTYISEEMMADPYIAEKILKDSNELYTKPQVFAHFNLTINYPMFYVDLIQTILRERNIEDLPKELLGSIVECHVRSLLPNTGSFEYRNELGEEIDYVSNKGYGIEISVANKRMKRVNLDKLPEGYKKILLTKDVDEYRDNTQLIPYYRFIYDLSEGRDLVEQIKSNDRNHTLAKSMGTDTLGR